MQKSIQPACPAEQSAVSVIDGFLTKAPDSTYITLTRSRNMADSGLSPVESNATLTVEDENASSYNFTPYWLSCQLDTNLAQEISASDVIKDYEYLAAPGHLFTLYEVFTGGYSMVPNLCGDCRDHGGTSVRPGFRP